MSRTASSLGIIAAGAAWRLFGSEKCAEKLLAAMDGEDEQIRMLAGISLVRAGERSFDLIEEKIESGVATPPVVRLLPDLDGPRTRELMQRILARGPDELRDAAAQCIDLLDRMEQK